MSVVYIINRGSKMALDIDADGISLIQNPFDPNDPMNAGSSGQRWNLEKAPGTIGVGNFIIRAHRNPSYAIVKGTGGDHLIVDNTMTPFVWTPHLVADPQYFFFLGSTDSVVGTEENMGQWMDVTGESEQANAGVQVHGFRGHQNQQWTFYPSFYDL